MTARFDTQSPLLTAFGVLIALVAIVGTQFLGWEWGSGQLVPTLIGILVAAVAVVVAVRRYSS
ncbi:multidrug transporter [Halobacteria archaeon AArc-m2/3/4]|uniref:Multidrug transporter n=1 Tax=Natronoglomus mannanivorans TaxID=2979990 RepID=A0ABT2QHX9_9EURY|nr:multidrug transporter [Halobacteria archaeon AArc-m2/3/4]